MRRSNLDLRVAIIGGGRVGLRTARMLDDHGNDVIVVEQDPKKCEKVSDEYIATVIEGDGTSPNILKQVDIDNCDVFAALTGNKGVNLGACVLAQRLSDSRIRTIMRIDSEEKGNGYEDLVDEVIFPEKLGAIGALNAIEGHTIRSLEDVGGNLEILDIEVKEGAPVAGKKLQQVSLPRGSLIVSDENANKTAGPQTVLKAGKRYIVAVQPDVADEVTNLFRG